ncbi:bifunctional serine/threonine-protein kinase/ABC transporter substrate-binding protein [Streptomyces sp. NPDC006208]|uniref:bifunctional serine/threonine-protein kinase/ABC transporter substrate-binding protein n=1 Tax=Streptomyces sp. NPDC006208 TaxID=3156734 RepID=UPI0033B9AE5E
MEQLRSSDPVRIADHRLLGRLGAGGMGVVYLARTPGGALVALKVLAAEYAEEPGFRERFRREVDVARRIRSPWAVPLVDADADAEAPWLATAYVPGPSLAEAVAAHGPLTEHGLRVLGGRLARALAEVHRAGLVHRDLKPGNVLIALDGPRLIDFGISRAPEDTALTATGLVVGTPGYLSPEQADGRGGQAIGPPSDVFSLGCVLAFAATGRPPFGTGALDALLYRAVHDPADLDGVPPALGEVVSRCLEKDPAQRPGADELVRELLPGDLADEPLDEPADDSADVLAHDRPDGGTETGGGAAGGGARSWLPEDITRLIARRSAAALALPDIDRTEISAGASRTEGAPESRSQGRSGPQDARTRPASGAEDAVPSATGTPRTPGRRRVLLLAGGAVFAAAAGAGWWTLGRNGGMDEAKPTASASSRRPAFTVAVHGDLSGTRRETGRAQERGLRLAVAEFNARGDAPFDVKVRAVDDTGDPAVAARLAKQLADDPSVLAVVGPTTDETAQTALAAYDAGLLPVLAVSPGAINLSVQGFRSFLHARIADALLPFYISAYLRGTAHSRKIGLIVDRAADNYGAELSNTLSRVLRDAGQPYLPRVVGAMRSGFGDTVEDLLAAAADSIAFAGLHDRGASLARTLLERDFSGARAAGPALLDPRFLTAAKEAAEGWTIVAPAIDASLKPEAKAFADAYRKRWKEAPPRYAAEAYDVAGMVLKALADLSAKSRTRKELLAAVRAIKYQGITRTFAFQKIGQIVPDGTGVSLWRVEDGRFVYGGPAPFAA